MTNDINNEIIEFIKRRFPFDCNWTSGNCYYFAIILKDRFPGGEIYYDVINGHFVYKYCHVFYDWCGISVPSGHVILWDTFYQYDLLEKNRIVRDCIQ